MKLRNLLPILLDNSMVWVINSHGGDINWYNEKDNIDKDLLGFNVKYIFADTDGILKISIDCEEGCRY